MDIIYRTGDLLLADERHILHGCNAQGKMNSGVAALIRAKWPAAYTEYVETYQRWGLELGDTVFADCGDRIIINAITQQNYGRNRNTVYVSYVAIQKVFVTLDAMAATQHIPAIAMPLVGAGLANGDWAIISKVIESQSNHFQPVVYLVDGKMP